MTSDRKPCLPECYKSPKEPVTFHAPACPNAEPAEPRCPLPCPCPCHGATQAQTPCPSCEPTEPQGEPPIDYESAARFAESFQLHFFSERGNLSRAYLARAAEVERLRAKEAWTLRLEETVIGFAVAVDCFRNGLGSSEDVRVASDRVVELGRQINSVREDQCPDCAGDLDTGWECNGCGKDWLSIGSVIVERTRRAALKEARND